MDQIALIENGIEQFEWPHEPFAWGQSPVYKVIKSICDGLTYR